ncbi:feline leukemia virus subgroup C receptor-related protein 2 isoform X2 [Neodiprion lecontei]|uniref:Feline leukemia virus subgroup C receptor-related protein 2 isoform X2 n=1 Tax=Neodiprion lecontei TaxID=441921 RepID=A0A6J0BD86_NEOLC|nr:feline leukemia virus subgroup C receptor-related protein 2 isoform X2 [Neodiprion lecontei]
MLTKRRTCFGLGGRALDLCSKIMRNQQITDNNVMNPLKTEHPEENEDTASGSPLKVRVFKRRWLQLFLYVLCSVCSSYQYPQFTIIGHIISRYYDVSVLAVASTSIVLMVSYSVFFFPALFLTERIGLKWTVVIGSVFTCLGAWIKVFSAAQDRFPVLLTGQAMVAVSQVFIVPVPGKLAAVWFGKDQLAFATAIGCYAVHAGLTICFLTIPTFVRNHDDVEKIGPELSATYWILAIACTVVTLAVLVFFQNEPSVPPSESRALQKSTYERLDKGVLMSVKKLVTKNRNFVILWNSYGLIISVFYSTATVLNPLILTHFKNSEVEVGIMNMLQCILGTTGSVIIASVLDKTKKFRVIAITVSSSSVLCEILFAVTLNLEIQWTVFLSTSLYGIALTSFNAIGFELCAEATYPESQALSTGILSIAGQIYGVFISLVVVKLMDVYGDTAGHAAILVILSLGTLLTVLNKIDLRRQKAEEYAARYNALSQGVSDEIVK